jgi:hypothetical protein
MPSRRFLVLPALLLAAAALPQGAEAQRDRCRVYSNGRWYDCDDDRVRTTTRTRTRSQWRDAAPSRQLSLSVGALRYSLDGEREHLPMAALRGDWRLTRLLRSELGVSYALGDAPALVPQPGGAATRQASVVQGTLGLLAELPTPFVRPYVGAAAGLFGRFDGDQEVVRPSFAFPVGLRIAFSPRVGLRAETRFRFDEHPSGRSAANTEFTAGLSVGY